MASKLGIFSQMMFGEWADRSAINRNAEMLESVEASVSSLQTTVARQAQEILRLRAMVLGVIEVVQSKLPIDDAELERAVKDAWAELAPPPPPSTPQSVSTDPYRSLGGSSEPTPEDVAAAKTLLRAAEKLHYAERFAEARTAYQEIVDRYGNTKQAATARQQIHNLRSS
jgi:hypothetical protein